MRHALVLLAFVLLLWGGQRAASAWRAADDDADGPRVVWLVLQGAPGPALNRALAAPDTQLVSAWWDGRVVQLRTASGAPGHAAAWLRIEGPPALIGLPGCGG
jgi:hypothetical protein